ncbi:MAG: hypothetical protein M5U16_13900 [Hyphomicrobium sp.]|nr:hypothetical protein [Hyphomicrobium sp.]
MIPKSMQAGFRVLVLSAVLVCLSAPIGEAAERYVAKLAPLNAEKIGISASGSADLRVADGKLTVSIDLAGLTPGLMHLQHFHGFPDGKDAACPTAKEDANGDGYIDLIETEAVAGTTMLPFHEHPATLEIPNNTYPVADDKGAASYSHSDSVEELEKALKEKLKAPVLDLAKRVIFVHGVASDARLPQSVKSLPGVPAQVTIPVACGKIEAVK